MTTAAILATMLADAAAAGSRSSFLVVMLGIATITAASWIHTSRRHPKYLARRSPGEQPAEYIDEANFKPVVNHLQHQ